MAAKATSNAICCHMPPPSAPSKRLVHSASSAAQQGPAQQHGCAQRHSSMPRRALGDGVVSRPSVRPARCVRQTGRELQRGGGDMPDPACRQPELGGPAQQQRGGKGQGEQQRGGNVVRGWPAASLWAIGANARACQAANNPTPATLAKSDQNLVWLDCGNDRPGARDTDRLLEIAVVVTGPSLEPRVEGPVFAIHQSDELLNKMDARNKERTAAVA